LITIIIPNYNGEKHLQTCLPSILNQTYNEFKLILVDNNSDDGSIGYTSKTLPEAIIIRLNYNSGFAKAINEGIRYSLKNFNSEYFLLLNNDIELDLKFLEFAVNDFKNMPEVSFIAVKMLNYFNRNIIDDCGDSIKFDGGSPQARGHGEIDIGQYENREFVFGVCAGAGFYRKEIFENAGLFDEKFIAYYEDFDLSFRAELMGYKALYEPKAICYHKRGGTSTLFSTGYQTELCERNLVFLRFKNYPVSLYLLYQPLFLIARLKRYLFFYKDYSFRIFFCAVKGYFRGIFTVLSLFPERIKTQKSKIVSINSLRHLFIK
jgi:GT2 family glycosyltransferase